MPYRSAVVAAWVMVAAAAGCSGGASSPDALTPSVPTTDVPTSAPGTASASTSTAPPTSAAPTGAASTTVPADPVDPAAVDASVELLAALGGPMAATTEVTTLVAHAGSLWATTSQWMAPEPVGGALVRRRGPDDPWQVVEQTDQLRVMALQRFTVPARHAGGDAVDVLVTQTRTAGVAELQWLVGDGDRLEAAFVLPDGSSDARSLGAHDEGASFAFYAGVRPTGVLRGEWDPVGSTIVWSATPELVVAGEGLDQKVTGFASCGGAAWVTVRASLYRRVDAALPEGAARWTEVYRDPDDNADNSGLRGITCVSRATGDALLLGREGPGTMLRFDSLDGEVLEPVVEADLRTVITATLQSWGHDVAPGGPSSVGYVIPAYNDLLAVGDGVHLTGVEWSYDLGRCPATRTCQPQRTFDAQACLLRRVDTDGRSEPDWSLWCLAGEATPADAVDDPVQGGQAFVAVRALQVAPWSSDELWLAGYDANFVPSVGTGWVGRIALADVAVTVG
jgi:hypothetical protein